ncbi:hypothetical protein BFP70_11265 [Thioclava sp. SK-1]|uniref:hypothetical protein n=1 Tax=Thioclava sp. SK-1 TaxID=1889770 RepID=UPI0008264035|nr:hypothetical protein [Thioclava sp. SK-1]OCX64598.1 hypothetical protein BFP70_11265 [Thioclava sp. SK-1]
MKTAFIALAAASVFAAGTASAQSFSAAQLQLATQAGVEAGTYSVAQLHSIIDAQRDNNETASVANVKTSFSAAKSGAVPANAQLSSAAEVPVGSITAGQANYLAEALRDPNAGDAELVKASLTRKSGSEIDNAGWAQLAAQAGVGPNATKSEVIAALTAQKTAREE